MSDSLDCLHMNHLNAVIEDFDESIEHFTKVFGAQFNHDLPGEHWHACLLTIGGVMFAIELMLPEVSVATFLPVAISTGAATFVGRWFLGASPAFTVPCACCEGATQASIWRVLRLA